MIAHRLGFRPGDTIASVNGRPMSSANDLLEAVKKFEANDRLTITVTRGGRQIDLQSVFQGVFLPGPPMFWLEQPSGRVDLVRTGNVIEARARGVAAFTVLLSPEVFDFSQPVKVVVNGRVAFEGRVERSLATLMKWAARDNDRTMLFGAELHITH